MGSTSTWTSSELLAACCGPIVKIWNPLIPDKQKETKLSEGTIVYALDWSSNNKVLAAAGDKTQISMYSMGQLIGQVPNVPNPAIDLITCMRFSHDSKKIIFGCQNRSLHLLDLRQQGQSSKSNVDHRSSLCSLAVSPEDSLIASSSASGQILLHDLKSGSKLLSLSTDGPTKRALTFSSMESESLAAAADDGSVCIWNIKTRLIKHQTPRKHVGGATGVAFAARSPYQVYTCGQDQRIAGVDIRQQQEMFSLPAAQPLCSLAARYDGYMLAAGTAAGGVLVFDLRHMQQAVAMYNFSEGASVREVRWQHVPHVSSKAAKAAAAAAATAGASAGAAPLAAAGSLGGMGGSLLGAGTQGFGPPQRAGSSGATGGLDRIAAGHRSRGYSGSDPGGQADFTPRDDDDGSRVVDGDADRNMRVLSPTQLSSSPSPSDLSFNTSTITPADSGVSSVGPHMATPGIGVMGGSRGSSGGGAPLTPISTFQPNAVSPGTEATAGDTEQRQQQRLQEGRLDKVASASLGGQLRGAGSVAGGDDSLAAAPTGKAPGGLTGAGSYHEGAGCEGTRGRASSAAGCASAGPGGSAGGPAGTQGAVGAAAAGAAPSGGSRPGGGGTAATSQHSESRPASRSGSIGKTSAGPGSRRNSTAGGMGATNSTAPGVLDRLPSKEQATATAAAAAAGRSSAARHDALGADVGANGAAEVAGRERMLHGTGNGNGSIGSNSAAAAANLRLPTGSAVKAMASIEQQQQQQQQALLREDVFKAYIDDQVQALRQDVRALHLDMLKQFHHAQMDLASVVEGLAARQEAIAEQLGDMKAQLAQLCNGKDQDISLAWL